MTYIAALHIQKIQLGWYCRNINEEQAKELRLRIDKRTVMLKNGDSAATQQMDIRKINEMVPRGVEIHWELSNILGHTYLDNGAIGSYK